MFRKAAAATFFLGLAAGVASAGQLTEGPIRLQEVLRGLSVSFEAEGWPKDPGNVVLVIEGPRDYSGMANYGSSVPKFDLREFGKVIDGVYRYEIRGLTGEKVKKQEVLDNGRDGKDREFDLVSFTLPGRLVVERGQIVVFAADPEKGSSEAVPAGPDDKGDEGHKPVEEEPTGKPVDDSDKG